MLNFKLKSSILLAALISISLQAQDYEVEDILPEPTPSEVMEMEPPEAADTSEQVAEPMVAEPTVAKSMAAEPTASESMVAEPTVSEPVVAEPTASESMVAEPTASESRSPTCPADFFTLPLYPNAKFCQLFAPELPASMSYFAVSDQQSAKEFYINQLGQAEEEKMLNGRIVLQYSNGQKVLVISKDGQGSQIDILIKSAG